ncbi:Stage 0 sporulation protein J [Paraconexibacter sp. AEG42_29]|uniref:Stage 0 sporulation protein J n=1 Tax=Paraconexibacter sp. AEG42_29 TaxID=2997339 RepID=A0AAU7B3I5_9ACTN
MASPTPPRKTGKTGMGRGLSAILAVTDPNAGAAASTAGGPRDTELRELAVEVVRPNPDQPRKQFDAEALQALADSLGERGVLQPVLVRPVEGGTFELVAGERRWRAAQLAGLTTLPAIVQDRDDAKTLEDALIENMAREDLNPVEEARAVAALVEELGLTREAVGKKVGRSRVAVSNLLRLLDLPDEVLDALQAGALSEGHGRALLMAEDHADRRRLARSAAGEGWSVRVTEQRAREANDGPVPRSAGAAAIHPDQEAAMARITERLGSALGTDVRVRPRGTGYKVELVFADSDEAEALAARLSER